MIHRNKFLLSAQVVYFKRFNEYHSNCLSKFLGQNSFIKWKKFRTVWSCQQRNIESQNSSNVVKSPYKHLEFPNVTLSEFLTERMEKFSKHVAIECGITGRKFTYAQLLKVSRKFAVSLLKAGLRPGQTIAVITPNCPEYAVIVLGCLEAGLIMSPINHAYTSGEIYNQLIDSGAACVVFIPDKFEAVNEAASKINNSAEPGHHVKLIALDTGSNEVGTGVGRFTQLIADYVDESELSSLRNRKADPGDVVVLPYSSGTTGLPKGVMLTHRNVVHNLLQMSVDDVNPFIAASDNHQEVLPGILPFYHIYGFTQILAKSLIFGAKIVTLPKFEPKTYLDTLKMHKCSILYLVPPLVLFMGSHDQITSAHCQHIHHIISGAAPLGAGDLERCLNKIPSEKKITYVQGYGLTETSPVLTYPSKNITNLSSVGAPISNTIMKVIDVESGKNLGPNHSGEVCAHGPQVMKGYLNNPKATAASIDTEGWFHTGDLGHYDEQGLFYITDRIKELIKVKGFQVPPAELEEVLRTMPEIKDVGVIGVPDKKSGEVPIAFIVQSGTNPLTASDVKSFMSKKVAPFKQLSECFFVNSIPKTASGKILRKEMLKIYESLKQK